MPSLNVELFAYIAEAFHLYCCLLPFRIGAPDGRLPNQRNLREIKLVVHDEPCDQYRSIGRKLQIPQMTDICEMFSDWFRPIAWRVIAQNSTKN